MRQQGVYPRKAQRNLKQVLSGRAGFTCGPSIGHPMQEPCVVPGSVALATVGSLSICAWTSFEACTNLSLKGQRNHRDPENQNKDSVISTVLPVLPHASSSMAIFLLLVDAVLLETGLMKRCSHNKINIGDDLDVPARY